MALIEAVEIWKDVNGEITHVTIDGQKHKDVIAPVLQQPGIIGKTRFQQEWAQAISIEDARERSLKHIDELRSKSE